MYKAGFRKGRGTRDQTANIFWIIGKTREFQKTSTSASLTMLKTLTVWITANCGKFYKRWEYRTTLPASWETCMQIKTLQLDLDMEQWTGSKLGKEYDKAVYCHFDYLIYIYSTHMYTYIYMYSTHMYRNARLDESQAGIKITRRNINNLR